MSKNSYNYFMPNQKSLNCEICLQRNYHVNIADDKNRLMIKKFCRQCNRHTLHKEEK